MGSGKSEFSLPAVLIVRIAESGTLHAAAERLTADFRSTLPTGVYASVAPMRDAFDRELRPWTLGATLFVTFGLLALVVATIGTYTATAYQVNRRTRELAIRVALGAAPRTLIRQVLRQGLIPVVVGVGVGIGIALLTGRYIASLLYETSPSSPLVLSVAAFTMIAAALAGCLWPALRAARVDPITILRTE
jgi:ABC-type antimicrobial peptide transport system permease subunit